MSAYFIADLHLSPDTNELIQYLKDFSSKLISGDKLFIIGDLFEYYVGLDKTNTAQNEVRILMKQLESRNIDRYFIHGNRDFLITKKDAEYLHLLLLPDIFIFNNNAVIIHGDELCPSSLCYLLFRLLSRKRFYQYLFFLFTCHKKRVAIAENMRLKSHKNFIEHKNVKVQIDISKALKFIKQKNVKLLIHGHTHNSCLNEYENNLIICDVGDWTTKRYSFLKIGTDNVPQLKIINIKK